MTDKKNDEANNSACNEGFYEAAKSARSLSRKVAIDKTSNLLVDTESFMSNPIPDGFGKQWAETFSFRRAISLQQHGRKYQDIIVVSARFFEYSKWREVTFMNWLVDVSHDLRPSRKISPEEYADKEGRCGVLAVHIGDLDKPKELLAGLMLTEFPPDYEICQAMSLVWYFEAARLHKEGDPRAFDLLSDAADAWRESLGYEMWEAGAESSREESPAKALAKKRHAENYALAAEALRHWRENIDPSLSAQKAADLLLSVVPLSHKKLAEIVSKAKKEAGLKPSRLRRAEALRREYAQRLLVAITGQM